MKKKARMPMSIQMMMFWKAQNPELISGPSPGVFNWPLGSSSINTRLLRKITTWVMVRKGWDLTSLKQNLRKLHAQDKVRR